MFSRKQFDLGVSSPSKSREITDELRKLIGDKWVDDKKCEAKFDDDGIVDEGLDDAGIEWSSEKERLAWIEDVRARRLNPITLAYDAFGIDYNSEEREIVSLQKEQEYFVEKGSNEFGLTRSDYQFLLDDIEEAITKANRKYGYGGYGFVDRFGNHYRDPQPRTVPESDLALERLGLGKVKADPVRPIPKVNPIPKRLRTRQIAEPGPLLEEIMLERGLLHAVKKREGGENRDE
jgi:hypothetical protein